MTTEVKTCAPDTGTGIFETVLAPFPSWPEDPPPQQYSVPFGAMPQACSPPASIEPRTNSSPVAWKTAEVAPAREAVSTLSPGRSPRLQLPSVAIPAASVSGLAPATDPPPLVAVKVMMTLGSG